jgi:hypothetical protein
MNFEYFDGDPEVLLVYGDQADAVQRLRSAIATLVADAPAQGVRLDQLAGFTGIDSCSLLAELGESNLGLRRVDGTDRGFRCVLHAAGWHRVSGLLEPFAAERPVVGRTRFQYLVEKGPIEWIVSTTRGW